MHSSPFIRSLRDSTQAGLREKHTMFNVLSLRAGNVAIGEALAYSGMDPRAVEER